MLDMQLLCCDVLHALHQAELSCAVLCCFLQTGLHAVLRYVVLLSARAIHECSQSAYSPDCIPIVSL